MLCECMCVQAFASTFMDVIKNSTVASAGLPTKLNSQGDVDVPMEASHRLTSFVSTVAFHSLFICQQNASW